MDKPTHFETQYFSESKGKWIPVSDMCDEHIRRAFKKVLNTEWYAQHFTDKAEYKNEKIEDLKSIVSEVESTLCDIEGYTSDARDLANKLESKLDGYR